MIQVAVSAYRCDPYGVSEAYSGFRYAQALAVEFKVLLCTPSYNEPNITAWMQTSEGERIGENIEILAVPMWDVDARLGAFGSAVKPGFFLYEHRLVSALRRNPSFEGSKVVWHRTPISFRFRTRLGSLGIPLVVGPLAGGLKPPPELADYFEVEGLLYRLRAFDRLLLASRFWMSPLDQSAKVLLACEYVRDILPSRIARRGEVLLDTAVDEVPPVRKRETVDDGFEVLFVGRLVRYKGPSLAVEAFGEFLDRATDRGGNAHLTIVGDGPEHDRIRRVVEERGLEDRVSLTGRLSREECLARYQDADVFIFPAITEASGNVYLEAMAAGLPLVVMAHGGGMCIPPDDAAFKIGVADTDTVVQKMADALMALHSDSALRESMGSTGRAVVASRYTWTALGEEIRRVIHDALDSTG